MVARGLDGAGGTTAPTSTQPILHLSAQIEQRNSFHTPWHKPDRWDAPRQLWGVSPFSPPFIIAFHLFAQIEQRNSSHTPWHMPDTSCSKNRSSSTACPFSQHTPPSPSPTFRHCCTGLQKLLSKKSPKSLPRVRAISAPATSFATSI